MKKNGKAGYSIKGRYGISANLVDRLVGANAKDYMSIMEKINSRKYFPKPMQEEIENIFKGTVKNSKFEYAGQKGGSTAFVLTKACILQIRKGIK